MGYLRGGLRLVESSRRDRIGRRKEERKERKENGVLERKDGETRGEKAERDGGKGARMGGREGVAAEGKVAMELCLGWRWGDE